MANAHYKQVGVTADQFVVPTPWRRGAAGAAVA
jgi:hypothetical protein